MKDEPMNDEARKANNFCLQQILSKDMTGQTSSEFSANKNNTGSGIHVHDEIITCILDLVKKGEKVVLLTKDPLLKDNLKLSLKKKSSTVKIVNDI